MGAAGKEVCKRFSWESMVDRYEKLLLKVTAKQTG
jgi:glycosyltransferase involved in cell wall biosynthesis